MPSVNRRHLLVGLVAISTLAGCEKSSLQFKSIDVTGADYAKAFALPDATGKLRQLTDFTGKVVVVFFGYTQCPDVCPTTLQELVEVRKILGPIGEKVQGIFVTVDPERDTPEVLQAYMRSFDPELIALRPSLAQLPDLAKQFKVFFKKVETKGGGYTMDHTAASYIYDPQGRVRLYSRYGSGPQALADDIRLLL